MYTNVKKKKKNLKNRFIKKEIHKILSTGQCRDASTGLMQSLSLVPVRSLAAASAPAAGETKRTGQHPGTVSCNN